jgi:hypothetical protein
MLDLCKLTFGTVIDLLRSRAALTAEILVLRLQINVLRCVKPKILPFGSIDRLILGGVCRMLLKMYDTLAIVRPGTLWSVGTVLDLDRIGAGNRGATAVDRL